MINRRSFQEKVLKVVKTIPSGRIATYKEVAEKAGRPKAWRLVGNILKKNRHPKIPCHRVVRSDGFVGQYNRGLKNKIKLLKKEGVVIKNQRINLKQYRELRKNKKVFFD